MLGISGLLLRYRGVLSFALPALVCLDACHNAYVIIKLYEEREKVNTLAHVPIFCQTTIQIAL